MRKVVSLSKNAISVASKTVQQAAEKVKSMAPSLKIVDDFRLKKHTQWGTGIGAFLLGPVGAFFFPLVSGGATAKKEASAFEKYRTIRPTFKDGAKAGALGALPVSLFVAGAGLTLAILGTISFIGAGFWAAAALIWLIASSLFGGAGSSLVGYMKKDRT